MENAGRCTGVGHGCGTAGRLGYGNAVNLSGVHEPYFHVGRSLGEFGNINTYFVRLRFVSKMMKIG